MFFGDDFWLAGLFVSSFVAATLLPGASEVLLAGGLLAGREPVSAVFVATLGNMLGAVTTFFLGKFLGQGAGRFVGISEEKRRRAGIWLSRYGSWLLLFSWLPVLGDPLVFAAGLVRLPVALFMLFTLIGKLIRYALVAWLTLGAETLMACTL